jgi:hypothetical protein
MISNKLFPMSSLDPRIKSSLLMKEVEFKPYSTDDILQILKDRCATCIREDALDSHTLSIRYQRGAPGVAADRIVGQSIVTVRQAEHSSSMFSSCWIITRLHST